jgi:hypothetical protein
MHEVRNGRALPKKLGIADDFNLMGLDCVFSDDRSNELASLYRYARFQDNEFRAVENAPDGRGDFEDGREIGSSIGTHRRSNGYEHDRRVADTGYEVFGKSESPCVVIALGYLQQIRLEEQLVARSQHGDFALVYIETNYGMAEFGEARSCDEPDVAGADDGNAPSLGARC